MTRRKVQSSGAPKPPEPARCADAAPAKPHARLENWTWILLYGGLFLVIFGIAAGRAEPAFGWSVAVSGAVIAVAGVVLIYVRSQLK